MKGFTLIEIIVILTVVMIGIGLLIPAAVTIIQTQRSQDSVSDLDRIYRAIVGNPARDEYGYLGDVGTYPTTLLDLVTSVAVGWRGPYVTDVALKNNILLDRFGGGVEYFNGISTSGDADCLTVVSKGPDLTSTNLAADPNIARPCVTAPGPLATTTPYTSAPENQDNIAVPDFIADVALLRYNPIGTLQYEILHNDRNPAVNSLVPGCPAFNNVTVTSATRGTADEISLAFNAGLRIARVQGLYDVALMPALSTTVIWREQVSFPPAGTVTKTINLSLDSSATPTYTLTIDHRVFGKTLDIFASGSKIGTIAPAFGLNRVDFVVNGCVPIRVENATDNTVIEQFTMPFMDNVTLPPPNCTPPPFIFPAVPCPTNFTKIYRTDPLIFVTACITNRGTYGDSITLLQEGLALGTIAFSGSSSTQCFTIRNWAFITVVDVNGAFVTSTGGDSFPGTTFLVASLNSQF